MLQNIRDNSQGIIAKIIVGFIVITFSIVGIESIVALGGGDDAPVVVNGEEISEAEIMRLVQIQKQRLLQQFGGQLDENLFNDGFLRQSVIEDLIEQKVAVTQAESLGAYASQQVIDNEILNNPGFQEDGKFSADRFKMMLRQNGLTPMGFRELMASGQISSQIESAASLSDVATPSEVERANALQSEVRRYEYATFDAKALEAEVEVSEEELNSYYEANASRYQTEETVRVDYVVLNKSSVEADEEIDEETLQGAYQDYVDAESVKEERKASHILIEITDERNEEAAESLAQQLSEKAKQGEDFAALAKEYSDDIGSKNLGGDLGFNSKGGFVEEFDDALFAMNKGDVSGAVKTEFGFHVIKLEDIRKPEIASFEDKKAEIEQAFIAEQQDAKFAELGEALAAAAFENENIADLVETSGLDVVKQTTALFTRGQGKGVAANPAVRTAAFSEKVLSDNELSDVIELSDSEILVLGLAEHKLPKTKALADVSAQITATLTAQKAQQLAKEKAEALQQKLAAGETVKVAWVAAEATFQGAEEVDAEVNSKAFSLAKEKGALANVATQQGYAVVRLLEVSQGEAQDDQSQLVVQQNASASLLSYRQWAKTNSEIERSGI